MNKPESLSGLPFSPELFRKEGHKLVDILYDYFREITTRPETSVLPWIEPDRLAELFAFDSGGGENELFENYIKRIIDNSIHVHHPRYIGHQVTSPLPLTALVHLCTSLLNNAAAVYEMGPVNMAMERNVIKYLGTLTGFSGNADGIFTHGGTAGNLTAMLAARQVKTEYNIWEEGVRPGMKPGYMISGQAHYSIARNIRIMGLGNDSVIKVPVDRNFRMRTDMLEELKERSEEQGIKVISVVASACSTATGSYDDLEAAGDFCRKHDLWFHVDGAHGMGVLFSDRYRDRVRGIEKADSVVIDFHKMFLVPAINTLVLFREAGSSYQTFAQKASYLFQRQQDKEWHNSAARTIECTKSSLGVIAYTALKYYGKDYYKEYIESRYDLAERFAAMVKSDPQLELAVQPASNIVCFRYAPGGSDENTLNGVNAAIRDRLIKDGTFYIVRVELDGKIWLRLTIINPMTSEIDLKYLLECVRDLGDRIST
jgi:L-2,4-diaminobutyrate decarboxylase